MDPTPLPPRVGATPPQPGARPPAGPPVGTVVRVLSEVTRVRELSAGHGDWAEAMAPYCGQIGHVQHVYRDGDLRVRCRGPHRVGVRQEFSPGVVGCFVFCRFPDGETWTYNPAAVTPVAGVPPVVVAPPAVEPRTAAGLQAGMAVRITDDETRLRSLVDGHRSVIWADDLLQYLGSVGVIDSVDGDDGSANIRCAGRGGLGAASSSAVTDSWGFPPHMQVPG
jgi:hypothetical protein